MLTPPDLAKSSIATCLYESYGLRIGRVTFLPIGADINTAVYRVDADNGMQYFLKLRRGDFDEVAVALPAWLHTEGIRSVLAPIPTTTQRLWVHAHGFDWILYPFIVGANGFEVALSPAQWRLLGQSMAAVHASVLPAELARRVPREDFAPRWRDRVRMYQQQVETSEFADPIAASFAALWRTKRHEIDTIVGRAEELGRALRQRNLDFVVCHTDLHGGNVLLGTHDELTIVDWDNPLQAPKERDLMFMGAGIGDVWHDAEEAALFYQGYGQGSGAAVIDPVALSYYRYERIAADFAAYGDEVFGALTSVEDRANGLRQVQGQFQPHSVVEIAHQTYQQLL